MSASYSHQQIIYALNSIANAPSGRHGTVQELQSYAKTLIQMVFANADVKALIGNWKLVWGTQVFQAAGSTVADNAMFVAQNADKPNEFVVAISGTNPISAYGWIVEDASLVPMVEWPYAQGISTARGKISHGTHTGLNVLLKTLKDQELTLTDFLRKQVSASEQPLSVTVTGHSLGGALSPAVALALKDTQGEQQGWDPKASASISVLPSAGPTPGNVTWRDYYDSSLGKSTTRLWNQIDMVPHAWQLSLLDKVPTLYVPDIPESKLVSKLVGIAELNSKLAGDMEQICPDATGLPGKVDLEANITIKDLLVLLEILLANKLVDKLGLSKTESELIKELIDHWIEKINQHHDHHQLLHKSSLLSELEAKGEQKLESLWGHFKNFIDFLKQVAYQHTTAYDVLLKTEQYATLVANIKKQIP